MTEVRISKSVYGHWNWHVVYDNVVVANGEADSATEANKWITDNP